MIRMIPYTKGRKKKKNLEAFFFVNFDVARASELTNRLVTDESNQDVAHNSRLSD